MLHRKEIPKNETIAQITWVVVVEGPEVVDTVEVEGPDVVATVVVVVVLKKVIRYISNLQYR